VSEPVVDVCIPAYERPGYIVETIESVFAQTFASWRLTISDDGLEGGEVAAAVGPYLADPRVRYLTGPRRGGPTPNWNRLFELATAPYVALLHDDDRWQPEFLARRVRFLDDHPDCGFVFSGINRVDELGRPFRRWNPPLAEGVRSPEEFAPLLLRSNIVGPPVSVLIRRSAYEAVGPWERRFPHTDYEMWNRLALRFPVGYLAVRDADYREHEASTTFQDRPPLDAIIGFANHVVDLADRERPGLLSGRDRRRARAHIMLEAIAFDALGPGDRRYASTLLAHALRAYPPALGDRRVLDWVRIVAGGRTRALAKRIRSTAPHSETA
jgi:glycosyltransferase involved in cell wall biosynthesis